ncbi:MAG: glycosyltransferase family 4 protein [Erythrobacter sp.]
MRRILFITRKWEPAIGGMETYCLRLTECLAKQADIDVISLSGQKDGSPPSLVKLFGFPLAVLIQWLQLRKTPDVVHLGDMAIWPLALLRMLLAPHAATVISAHGTDISYSARGGVKGTLYGLYQKAGARLLSNANVIANSQATANACRNHGWSNVSVVALATDVTASPAQNASKTTILFAGRMIERKGLRWFIENVLPSLPDSFNVEIAGVVTDPSEARALEHPRVHFLGGLDQKTLSERYSAALCVIVPNIDLPNGEFEGFGLVACEAAACGGLVLAAATGGLTSAVKNGETGFLLPAGNASAWAKRISQVSAWSDEERQSFLIQARAKAIAYYNWDRVTRETIEAYPQTGRHASRKTSL